MKFLQKLFAQPSRTVTCVMQFDEPETPPIAENAEAAQQAKLIETGETLDAVYEEFCRTVCHKPGVNLMETIRAERIPELEKWLHWKNNNAETMAFLTMMVNATRQGIPIWEQTGIKAFHHGGKPPRDSVDALATLAQIIGLRIRLFYADPPDSGNYKVWEFEP